MPININSGSDGAVAIVLGDADRYVRPAMRFGGGTERRCAATFAPGGNDLLLSRRSGCGIGEQDPPSVALV